ncbi:MAG: MFS transporter [candidate division WOR-3 bacterium]
MKNFKYNKKTNSLFWESKLVEYWKKAAVVMGLGTWTDAMDFAVIMYAVAMLVSEWKLTPVETTWLLTTFGVGGYISMLLNFVTGPLIDAIGRKKMWVIGNLIAGIAYLGASTAPNWFVLTFWRLLGVLTLAFTLPAFYTLMPEEVPADKRQTIIALAGILNMVGVLNINLFLALTGVFPWLTWRIMAAYVGFADLLLAILGLIILREPPLWQERRKLIKEGKIPKEESKVSYREILSGEMRKKWLVAVLVPLCFSMTGIATVTNMYLSYFQAAILKWSPAIIGVIGLIGTIVGAITRMLMGPISDRVGRLNTIIIFAIPSAVACVLLWNTPNIVGIGEHLPVVAFYMIMSIIFGLGTSAQEDTGRTYISEVVPARARGTSQSLLQALKTIVLTPLQTAAGLLAAVISPTVAYGTFPLIGFILGVAGAIAAKKMGLETRGKILD